MRLEGLKIAVTGGEGYIGSHTCKSLKAAGAEVISVDNRIVRANRLAGVEYYNADYADNTMMSKFRQDGINGIVHCAGTSLVGPSVKAPSDYYNNNVVKTIQLLDHCKTWANKPFIVFSSSAAVYGDPEIIPIKENDYIDPTHPYGNTKMMIERVLTDYDVAYGIKHYSFRYFNAAGADVWDSELGPEPGDKHIIPQMFQAYREESVFKLYGSDYNTIDGTCVRDYIHVCDIALAHLKACVELSDGAESQTYNLGTNNGYSNQQVLDIFKEIVGDVDVLVKEKHNFDAESLVADAKRYYNSSTPAYSDMKTIIESYKDYYEKHK